MVWREKIWQKTPDKVIKWLFSEIFSELKYETKPCQAGAAGGRARS